MILKIENKQRLAMLHFDTYDLIDWIVFFSAIYALALFSFMMGLIWIGGFIHYVVMARRSKRH